MAARRRAPLSPRPAGAEQHAAPRPLLYTAQDVARFCQVDLKTVHTWANAGKIPHHRTTGRHLRFRHGELVAFLRSHGYPLTEAIRRARPSVSFAADEALVERIGRRLEARFEVRTFASGIEAIAHLVASQPDALVLQLDDPTWPKEHTLTALKRAPSTSWATIVVVGGAEGHITPGADLVVPSAAVARLPAELAARLGVRGL